MTNTIKIIIDVIWVIFIIIMLIQIITMEKRIAKARNYRKEEYDKLSNQYQTRLNKLMIEKTENTRLRNENKLLNSQYKIGDTITFVRNNKIVEDIVIGLNYEIRVEKEKNETYVAYKTLAYGFIGEEELDYDFVLNSLMERLNDLEKNAVKVNREIKEVKENNK